MAMTMNVGALVAHLKLNATHFTSGINSVSKSLNQTANTMRTFGKKMSLYIGLPLTLFGRQSVQEFSKFNKAIIQSSAILKGMTDDMIKDLEETALTMSTVVATSAVDLARAYWEMGQAGLSAAQAQKLLPVVEKFAYVGSMDLARAVTYLTKSQRALGMEMKDPIENMREMKRVSDNLTYAAIESTAKVLDFSEAMKNAGPMLRVLNKSIEEGVAALMTLANQGHVGSEAGTQLYMVYRDLQRAFITHKNTWRAFGLDVYDVNRNMLNLVDILEQLEMQFEGMTDEGTRSALMLLGFQDRSLRATQAMLGQSEMMRRFYHDLTDIAGVTEKVANTYLKAFSAQMDILRNKISIVRIAIGGIIADQLTKLNAIMDKILIMWRGLSDQAKKFIVYIGEAAVLLGPFIVGLSLLVKVFAALVSVIGLIFSPLGLLIAIFPDKLLLGMLGTSKKVRNEFENIKDTFVSMYQTVSEKLKNWTEKDTIQMEMYVKRIGIELDALHQKFKAFMRYVGEDFGSAVGFIWELMKPALEFAFEQAIELAIRGGQGVWKALKEALRGNEADQFWAGYNKDIKEQSENTYKEMMKGTPGGGYVRQIPTAANQYQAWKRTNDRLFERIQRETVDRLNQEIYSRFPKVGAAAAAGATPAEIELMVNIELRNERIREQAHQISTSVMDGWGEGVEAGIAKMREKQRAVLAGEGNVSAARDAMFRENEEIDKNTAKRIKRLYILQEERNLEAQIYGNYKQGTDAIREATNAVEKLTAAERIRQNKRAFSEQEIALFTESQDESMMRINRAMAGMYEGMEHLRGSREAQLHLLELERIVMKSLVGDSAMLNRWEQRRLALLEQMNDDHYKQKMKMYEVLRDENGVYEMQLKLLQNESRVLETILDDEKLRLEYIERQRQIAAEQRDINSDDFWAGVAAAIRKANREMTTFGQLGEMLVNSFMDDMTSGIWEAVKGTREWGDALRNVAQNMADIAGQFAIKGIMNLALGGFMSMVTPTGPTDVSGMGAQEQFFGSHLFGTKHSGGIVGSEGIYRRISSLAFAGAIRAHSGLGPDEIPIIAKRGEGVFTPGQMRALGGGMSDDLLGQILMALRDRQTIALTIADKRDVLTKKDFNSREGESMVMRHVNRNQ